MLKNQFFFLILLVQLFATINCQTCTNKYGSANQGECKNVDDCKGAALVGNCTGQQICCIPDPNSPPSVPSGIKLTKQIFLKLVGNTPRNDYLYNFIASAMQSAALFTGSFPNHKTAAFLAQLVGESDYFRNLESKIVNDTDNDTILGNNQAGDGVKFMGRGGILLRGRTNYALANNSNSLSKITLFLFNLRFWTLVFYEVYIFILKRF